MRENIRKLFEGKRKFVSIPAIPITALVAWPFVIPALIGLVVHKKVNTPKLKYGLLAFLTLIGVGSAPGYYNSLTNSVLAQPKTIENRTIDAEVKAAIAPTNTPTPTLTPVPTETPKPTLTPTYTPRPTLKPTNTPIPTRVYIAPTTIYVPPTEVPPVESNSRLDNNNYYTNTEGNRVHSPANTMDGSVPAGASAQCGDGTYSFSQSRRGTCSHHGGVAQWL
jgi:hypothetical protein